MLFSLNKLREIASLPEDKFPLNKITAVINSLGFEVESVEKFADIEGVKFGKILETSKNKNSEKLTIARIQFDDKERTIQTTATNVVEGMIVLAFVPGSRRGEMEFGAKKMAGVLSEGMLTSFGELGFDTELLNERHNGITEYNVDISEDPIKVLGLNDHIIDVDILANRPDANSYIVLGHELASYFGTKYNSPRREMTPTIESSIDVKSGAANTIAMIEVANDFELSLEDEVLLYKSGIKSVNKFVDLTSIILLMSGQPTHAYDKDKVTGPFTAEYKSGKVQALGKKIEIDNNLVITSGKNIISLAGVIGIDGYGASKDTKTAIIEMSIFNPKDVRHNMVTAKFQSKVGIQSSKNIGWGTIVFGLQYLAARTNSYSEVKNFNDRKRESIKFSTDKLGQVFGMNIAEDERYPKIVDKLEKLGFSFISGFVEVPTYRADVTDQQDMEEEFFRFYGYNNLKPTPPKGEAARVKSRGHVSLSLAAMGYTEVISYTLVNEKEAKLNPWGFDRTYELETFISVHHQYLRNTLLPSMNKVIQHNLKQKINDLDIFEIGFINATINTIAIASTSRSFNEVLKNVVEVIGQVKVVGKEIDELHPNISAELFIGKKKVGIIGQIHPSISKTPFIFAEFTKIKGAGKLKVVEFEKLPMKSLDVTYELSNKEELGSKISKDKVFSLKVIDVYEDGNIKKITVRYIGTDKQLANIK